MSPVDLATLVLLGAVLGLDVVSFPQAQVSRPLVAATLAGALMGQAMSGLLVGATLELIALETLPVGASRYPEWGSAAVVGGALFARVGGQGPGAMSLAVLATLATAWVGGWTMVLLRRLNGIVARRARPALAGGSRRAIAGVQLFGLGADFVRGGVLTFTAFAVFQPLVEASIALWGSDPQISRAVVVALSTAVAAAAVWKLFHGTEYARLLFIGGLLGGLSLLALR
jgi:PTS system mannose-specific IIC component